VDVRATRDDLAVMLDNLLENAIRYSPAGAPVTIEIGANDREGWVHVLDEGPGIDAADAGKIFDRFARGSASRGVGGTGLGLAIVRALAERWGGTVTLSNRPRGGARAEVRLPLATGSAALPFPNPELAEALRERG
jgi:signal transduction histidine kinase